MFHGSSIFVILYATMLWNVEEAMRKAIGIVGGVGPMAGIDLAKKVFAHTKANKDQEHIDLYLTSCPALIPDRTDYLLEGGDDPAPGMQLCFDKLASIGATAIGVSCNTAHSDRILSRVNVPKNVVFVNMIDSTCRYIKSTEAER